MPFLRDFPTNGRLLAAILWHFSDRLTGGAAFWRALERRAVESSRVVFKGVL